MKIMKSQFRGACAMPRHSPVVILATLFPLFLFGCATRHYRVDSEAVPVEALESYKMDKPDDKPAVPARIQVVNFVVNSVDANYSEADKRTFRNHNAVEIPNKLQKSLGERHVFSEVARVVTAVPSTADYVVSGTYDFSDKLDPGFMSNSHSITVHCVLHIRLLRTKDNQAILDKDYVEDRTDEARKNEAISVKYLQAAFIEPITAEIKGVIAEDLKRS
jgi:hypothetical protein